MTLNLERYTIVLNVLLVAAIAYFAALSVSDLFAMRLAANAVPPVTNDESAAAEGGQARPQGYYQLIVRRDIFNLTPAATMAQNTAQTTPEDDDLRITLLGTSHISGARSFAIIEDQNGDQVLYRQGDMIPDAGEIVTIGHDRAVILHNGRQIAIEIPSLGGEPGGAGGSPGGPMIVPRGGLVPRFPADFRHRLRKGPNLRRLPRPVPGSNTGVSQVAPNKYLVDREKVNNDMQDMAKLFTQVRAVPNIQNGSSNGFALSEIQPGSLFEAMGLHDGDVVTSIGGQSLSDPRKAIAVLQSLQTLSDHSINVSVVRNGAPVNLMYTVH
ncbi:MAG TPA: type II secretion system protein GspC [Candidatus Binataceae bacterium]|nr:type II secretion system protein GspC [Candidatus Binataceae bacterium]